MQSFQTFRDVAVQLDERFDRLVPGPARLEKLAEGFRWAEGPAYFPAGRYLVWSDIPNDRMMRYDETSNAVSVFRTPAGYSNGNTVDRQGRLITCEHGNRRVTRTEHDGSLTVLASHYQGKRFNSPNDAVVKSDGHVYRIDPGSGDIEIVADDFVRPNGIAFSPDESRLYVADTGATHMTDGPRHIRVFDVGGNGRLTGGEVFATSTNGLFDGFRLDEAGRLWTSAGDGVHCYAEDGTLIGKVLVPEAVANVAFGGPKRNRLYICGTTSLYAIMLHVNGAKTF
jgi:gluconolactonase